MASDTELAWAAGFFDGEGCIARNGRRGALTLTISQNDVRPLVRFKAVFPDMNLHGPYRHRVGACMRPHFQLRTSRLDLIAEIRDAMWPYLSAPKVEQFNRVYNQRGAELSSSLLAA